jgi:hydroxypyruvate isomerase
LNALPSPFCVNISMLYPELSTPAALGRVEAAGFCSIELWWPFPNSDPSPADQERLADAVAQSGLSVLMLNAFAGDIRAGDRGIAAYPEEQARFRQSVETAAALCRRIACPLLHILIGNARPNDGPFPGEHLIEQLATAAEICATADVRVVIEPQNSIDAPRYPLHTIADGVALATAVKGRSGYEIGVLLDLYHLWREQGEFEIAIESRLVRHIFHVQIADFPGRGAPGTGSAPVFETLKRLRGTGYSGAFGLEYVPTHADNDDYVWLSPALRRDGLAT